MRGHLRLSQKDNGHFVPSVFLEVDGPVTEAELLAFKSCLYLYAAQGQAAFSFTRDCLFPGGFEPDCQDVNLAGPRCQPCREVGTYWS